MSDLLAPLFSGGTGRSGTTSVVNLLSRHSLVHTSLPREIRFLTDPYGLLDLNTHRSRIIYSRSSKGKAADLKRFILREDPTDIFAERMRTIWFENVGKTGKPRGLVQSISRDQLDDALLVFRSNFKISRIDASRELFQKLATLQIENGGKASSDFKYFADSTPINILHSAKINRFLPGSKFINMVRDGRDVAFSVTKEHWGPNNPYEALTWWAGRMADGYNALNEVAPESQLTLRLEDLIIHDREKSYAEILNFLGLPDEERLHRYFDENLIAEKMTQGAWRDGAWRDGGIDLVTFEKMYGRELKKLADMGCIVEQYY